jgi:membrane protease YdiL (CAAX protease family)
VTGALHPATVCIVPILFGFLYLIQKKNRTILTMLFHVCFTALCLSLFFHLIPGVTNFKVFDAVYVGQHCKPFTMYLNIENGIIAFLLMITVIQTARTKSEWRQVFLSTGIWGSLCILTLMGAALALGHVAFNPKLPTQTFVFLINNLMLVCIAEETFFRGYIQKNLANLCDTYRIPKTFALILASVIFGLRHYQSGIPIIILSTIAGLFYGAAYMRNNRIEAAILVHFTLNATHFFLFSYPSIMR